MSASTDRADDIEIPTGAVAIVGLAARLPGAANPTEFWKNLCAGVESISRFKDEELEDSFDADTRAAPNFVRARPILKGIEDFDAEFFGMYAKEAELTDPQHRVLLECAWEALEDAGFDPAQRRGAVGVFAGSSINTYFLRHVLRDRATIERFTSDYQVGSYPMLLGAGQDFTATRIAYKLDLTGPAINLNSACSTSLLAVAQACQSLLLYQCDAALAGGASISLPQRRGYLHLEGGMASADGHCRSFDAEASGTVFGSGAGMVLLRRLEDALADDDHIYAVIRGCGVNNDGAQKAGYTAPSVAGQAACIEMAQANAGIDPRTISYVECHGTATPLGDPIEVAGLTQAFRAGTADTQFCKLGSAKSNVGHLDAAAGVAGLIKTALMLKHAQLPPSLHYRNANPQIAFAATPFSVQTELADWPRAVPARRAGVSAFGVGGTNVHVVLEEAPTPARREENKAPQLLVLSARNAAALDAARANLAQHLRAQPQTALADVAYTLQTGRRAFVHRLAFVARDCDEALAKLEGRNTAPCHRGEAKGDHAPPLVFMFPGQGSQYPDMGRGFYETQAVFRDAVDRCAQILQPLLGQDLRALLYPTTDVDAAAKTLMATIAAQPAIFTIEYALAQLWLSWGLQPAAMIGHSIGEFVAATLAGVFALDDALAVIAARGRLMQALPGGAMLAVRLPESALRPLLGEDLSLAAINGPTLCVVSGAFAAVEAFETMLAARNVVSRRLHTSHAFHSAMVDPVIAPLREVVQRLPLSPPKLRCISCVTGTWLSDEQATSPDYWARHAREPVRFADGIATVVADGAPLLLEVGPGTALTTLALQCTRGRTVPVFGSLPDATRATGDLDTMLETLGRLWLAGSTPDWRALHAAPQRVPLPTYPFQRSRHWLEAPTTTAKPCAAEAPAARKPESNTSMELTVTAPAAAPSTALDEHRNRLHASIVALLEDLSGEQPPADNPDASFLEMGFDSLFLTQVSQRLQSQHKVRITFRQLLGEYSTIPALAAFLAEQVPAPAAKPAVIAAPPRVAAPSMALPAANDAQATGIETLFRDQLNAMSQLINRQMDALHARGAVALAASPVAAAANAALPEAIATAPVEDAEQRPSRFQVYKPGATSNDTAITPAQQAHIEALAARYAARLAGSKKLTEDARAVLADPRAASGFRAEWKEMVFPIVCARSKGSKLWDVDGNEYVDLVNGYGQTAFGHTPDFVAEAVKAQLDRGFAIGPQSELAGRVAALFAELTGNERVTFCNTGSEAVMAAMRVARNITGRNTVVVFNGAYHGQFDEVLVKGVQKAGAAPRSKPVANGIPDQSVANMVVLDYGSDLALAWIREHAEELAAVVVETVQSRHPSLLPLAFLRELRAITEASGTAFVMDEVVTGFRVHPGGMQAVTGIRADLATYGKVVGGGLPVGILAGRAKFMDGLDGGAWTYGDDSFPEVGVTFFAGTFVRHPLALAAVHATLEHIKAQGPALQAQLTARTTGLVAELNGVFAEAGLATRIESYSSWFYFNFHNEHPLSPLFFYHLRERGLHIQDGFPCFLTTAHSEADLHLIVDAFRASLAELQAVGILGAARAAEPAAPITGLPLTEPQFEVWLAAQQGDEASCAFNESVTLRLRGSLDVAALKEAMNRVVARHEALRASFSATGEELRIAAPAAFDYPTVDLAGTDAEAALAAALDDDARTPFDLVNGAPIRAQLLRLGDDEHAFMLTAHHIVCDGWSINVIVDELTTIYAALRRGETPQLPTPMAFSAYAQAERRQPADEAAKTEGYWLEQFASAPPVLDLPTDRPRAAQRSYHGASLCRRIEAPLYQAIKKAGARNKSTLFAALLAAFEALAGRLGGQQEVVIGVPTAGQSLLDDATLVGHCVNLLPIRGAWTTQTTIAEHLAAVSKQVLDAYEHQRYTFGTLVRKLGERQLIAREPNRLPLTELQFNLERLADRLQLPGLTVDVEPNAKAFVNFDLFLNVIESAEGLRLDCDYNTALYDAATIARWLDSYQALLEAFVADATQPLVRANCLPAAARQQQFETFNETARSYPREACLHQLFEAQAARTPDAIAAQFGEARLSYAALDRRANQLANLLRARIGVSRKPVGILVERSLEMLVALLATLKAGCPYLPLDASHPSARLRHILGEAEIAALITDDADGATLVATGTPVLHFAQDAVAIAAAATTAPGCAVGVEDLAYLIYTSGSTGLPKGVEVSHRAVVNLLLSMAREPGLGGGDVLLAVTTIAFDIAALELFLPLLVGARVVIADADETIDGGKLRAHLEDCGATAMQATPATWRLLLEAEFQPAATFKMLCGGEALPRELANRLLGDGGELWNMYGPTETTIWSTCARIEAGEAPVTIGTPIANTQCHVLDANDQPLPLGVPGQLHLGGDGLARGYYRRTELSAEKFIANPFGSGRLYRSGDLARWLPDGRLLHLGRMDHQTKLRGFRIELGEIEACLLQHAGVAAAAVLLREDVPGVPRLAAYVVAAPDGAQTPAVLRGRLAEYLPDYMIPTQWVTLAQLPLTPNGKLDRAALPAPEPAAQADCDYVAPDSATEKTLAGIWMDVLHLARVGVTDDLFALGADSIQMFQIAARASRENLKVSAKQLIQCRTVGELARQLDQALPGAGREAPERTSSLRRFIAARKTG